MSYLSVEVVKKPLTCVLHIGHPLDTMRRLVTYFEEIRLMVNAIEMYRYRNGDAMLIIKCQVEDEKINDSLQAFGMISGVMTVERVETSFRS